MAKVTGCDVPAGSLLARFGGQGDAKAQDYRDCFYRDVPNFDGREVTLAEFIERFYRSAAFLPERLVLKAIAGPSSRAVARAFARGETDRFGAWEMVERRSATSGPQGRPPARSDATEGRVSEDSLRGRTAPPALEAKQTKLDEALLESRGTGTASWFAVEPIALKQRSGSAEKDSSSSAAVAHKTRLYFGSWVGNLEQSGWRSMLRAHLWYSRWLLGGV